MHGMMRRCFFRDEVRKRVECCMMAMMIMTDGKMAEFVRWLCDMKLSMMVVMMGKTVTISSYTSANVEDCSSNTYNAE